MTYGLRTLDIGQSDFDYVIVGAGSAGCAVASRLTENPSLRVALLEAGGSDKDLLIRMPGGFAPLMQGGRHSWLYETAPQGHLGGRILPCPRGKVLGGGSSINGMVYCRGAPHAYDQWARSFGAGWSYADVLPYFLRAESYEATKGALHGSDGPISVSRPGLGHPIAMAWVEAAQQAGFAYNDDTNGVRRDGFGPVDVTISKGKRSSSASGYLRPVSERPNLAVITQAHATRIVFVGKKAVGVEFSRGGEHHFVGAAKEVILSAGAINSPHLLMLSGIGDGEHLSRHGIEPIIDLRGVGRNFVEHPTIAVSYSSLKPITLNRLANPFLGAGALAQYLLFGNGVLAESAITAIGFVKSANDVDFPDLKLSLVLALTQGVGGKLAKQHGYYAYIENLRPQSVGTLTLRSSYPFDAPVIDPNLLADDADVRVLREGVRVARKIFRQPALAAFRGDEITPGAQVGDSDAQIDVYVRFATGTDMHTVGTCKMGRDDLAVVDENLFVRGVEGLRVVDSSVIPFSVGGNTNMPTIMLAEKASDIILGRPPLAPISTAESAPV